MSFPTLKRLIKRIPIVAPLARRVRDLLFPPTKFETSGQYWEERYAAGGDSGDGSYDRLAAFKAEILNEFVAANDVRSVIEFGCGDGAQLVQAEYPSYVGVDVSESILRKCRDRFSGDTTKSFYHSSNRQGWEGSYDLAMSLDVIYHLIEDEVFDEYMRNLFSNSQHFVAIYSSDKEDDTNYAHVRHRVFSRWIESNLSDWSLREKIDQRYPLGSVRDGGPASFADLYFYEKKQ